MKAIRLGVAIIIALVILLASCEEARTQTNNISTGGFVFPVIGTVEKVTDYAVQSVNVITVFVWTYDTNNQRHLYSTLVWYGSSTNPITSKFQLDQQIIAPELTNVLHSICTNTDPTMDKNRGVLAYVGCDIQDGESISYDNLYIYQTNKLIENTDGTYSVPDPSSFTTTLDQNISFYVPNLQWARVEVGNKGDQDPFLVDDKLYNPASNPIDNQGFIEISTDYITNSSTDSGDFWIKITTFNGIFQIFNGDGSLIPETPMVLGITKNETNILVGVNGGDSGRGYMLQCSSDLKNWTNSPVCFFSPQTNAPTPQFSWPLSSDSKMFFRTATTNLSPTN